MSTTGLSAEAAAQVAEESAPGEIGPEFGWTEVEGFRCKHCHGPVYVHPTLRHFWGCPKDGAGYNLYFNFEEVAPAG